MAKAVTIKVKLVSSADTGFYYVAKKNSRTMTDKLDKKKYDPVADCSSVRSICRLIAGNALAQSLREN